MTTLAYLLATHQLNGVDWMEELRHALTALRQALERYEHPPEEAAAEAAAREVEQALNGLLESPAVEYEGIVRLDVGKSGAVLRINGGTAPLVEALRKTGA